MSARTRAAARLDRWILDPPRWDGRGDRGPTQRVLARAERISIAESPGSRIDRAPGAALHLRSGAVREMRIRQAGRPAPNAPLLIRLVRTPFVHPAGKPVRIAVPRPDCAEAGDRPRHEGPGRLFQALLQELVASGPMRVDHRPPARPRPFRRAREEAP